jgi:hypothetical protein
MSASLCERSKMPRQQLGRREADCKVMRELTDDDRAMYRALRDTLQYAEVAERVKHTQVRETIDAMHKNKGSGPSLALLAEIDSLAELRHAAEMDFDAFLRQVFENDP